MGVDRKRRFDECRGTYSVVRLNEGVVDGDDLDIGVLDGVAEDDSANATETVNADLDGSHFQDLGENFCTGEVSLDESSDVWSCWVGAKKQGGQVRGWGNLSSFAGAGSKAATELAW